LIITTHWKLRDAARAELRERGIESQDAGTAEEAVRALASGDLPSAIVLEATSEFAAKPAIQHVVTRVPTILIASRTETVRLSPVAAVVYRPVNVSELVAKVGELLARGRDA
jgi:DNA-binding response OmpR family regulator